MSIVGVLCGSTVIAGYGRAVRRRHREKAEAHLKCRQVDALPCTGRKAAEEGSVSNNAIVCRNTRSWGASGPVGCQYLGFERIRTDEDRRLPCRGQRCPAEENPQQADKLATSGSHIALPSRVAAPVASRDETSALRAVQETGDKIFRIFRES